MPSLKVTWSYRRIQVVNMPDDPAQIVRFWHALEMFSPQKLPAQMPGMAPRAHAAASVATPASLVEHLR
jgi:hypothetical protein